MLARTCVFNYSSLTVRFVHFQVNLKLELISYDLFDHNLFRALWIFGEGV